MGMYTEIYVNVDLKKETPKEVLDVLQAIVDKNGQAECLKDKPDRWSLLFNSGSYYTPNTECGALTFDETSGIWSLIGKGDIKNYEGEIEAFFDYIMPWIDDEGFIGYSRYEESWSPKLYFKGTYTPDSHDYYQAIVDRSKA